LALPGVIVTVTAAETGTVRTSTSSEDGWFTITNLAPGAYDVRAELSGFAEYTPRIVLGVGQIQTIARRSASPRHRRR
jgi:hypothetical protein